ncbi:hypothetical protein T484DRAFT_1804110 [Baffinella frigidus]|nr:hypothetical protein T484DRAFT_1804110 [Cryptophyta sp. CCMP2293]
MGSNGGDGGARSVMSPGRATKEMLAQGYVVAASARGYTEEEVVHGTERCLKGALVKVSSSFENNKEWPSLQHFFGKEGRLVGAVAGGWGWTAKFGDLEGTFRTRDGVYMLAYIPPARNPKSESFIAERAQEEEAQGAEEEAAQAAAARMQSPRSALRQGSRSPRKTPRARLADQEEGEEWGGTWAEGVPVAEGARIPSPALVLPYGAAPVYTLRGATPRDDAPSDFLPRHQGGKGEEEEEDAFDAARRGPPQSRAGPPQNRPGAVQRGRSAPQSRAGPPQNTPGAVQRGRSAPQVRRPDSGGGQARRPDSGGGQVARHIGERGQVVNPFEMSATGPVLSVARLMHDCLANSIQEAQSRNGGSLLDILLPQGGGARASYMQQSGPNHSSFGGAANGKLPLRPWGSAPGGGRPGAVKNSQAAGAFHLPLRRAVIASAARPQR